jgi:hypothetical protein
MKAKVVELNVVIKTFFKEVVKAVRNDGFFFECFCQAMISMVQNNIK